MVTHHRLIGFLLFVGDADQYLPRQDAITRPDYGTLFKSMMLCLSGGARSSRYSECPSDHDESGNSEGRLSGEVEEAWTHFVEQWLALASLRPHGLHRT
jgi:hypothetical protein